MSKLDEKLKASVKPTRAKPAPAAKPVAAPKPSAAPKPAKLPVRPRSNGVSGVDLNASTPPLFPERIWPD